MSDIQDIPQVNPELSKELMKGVNIEVRNLINYGFYKNIKSNPELRSKYRGIKCDPELMDSARKIEIVSKIQHSSMLGINEAITVLARREAVKYYCDFVKPPVELKGASASITIKPKKERSI